jgi:hypothetical protein
MATFQTEFSAFFELERADQMVGSLRLGPQHNAVTIIVKGFRILSG